METVTDIIRAFGGYRECQTTFGVSRSLLALWEVDGIPAKRWQQIVHLADKYGIEGVTLDMLSGLRPSKSAAPSEAA